MLVIIIEVAQWNNVLLSYQEEKNTIILLHKQHGSRGVEWGRHILLTKFNWVASWVLISFLTPFWSPLQEA